MEQIGGRCRETDDRTRVCLTLFIRLIQTVWLVKSSKAYNAFGNVRVKLWKFVCVFYNNNNNNNEETTFVRLHILGPMWSSAHASSDCKACPIGS